MFTGIIEKKEKVIEAELNENGLTVTVVKPLKWSLSIGESVNINGVCSTVIKTAKDTFTVRYMEETLNKTSFKGLKFGQELNLERSLNVGDRISGHFVYGHVDTTGVLKQVSNINSQTNLKIQIPKAFLKFLAYKGSVAINGVSLTVSKKNKNDFEVSLIPYTLKETNLGELKKGDMVNIETDIIAKYILENAKRN